MGRPVVPRAKPDRPRRPRGRPPKAEGEHIGHRSRPPLASRFPVHVTLKGLPTAPHFRRGTCFRAVRFAFNAGKDRFGFRLVHFTVQGNHLHLICEAKDRVALTRGMQGLAIRTARRVNKKTGRSGRLFAERYHARILRTPAEVRRALVYVLNHSRRHDPTHARSWIDPLSSAPWFDGWRWPVRERHAPPEDPAPIVPASTRLLASDWRPLGLIRLDEIERLYKARGSPHEAALE